MFELRKRTKVLKLFTQINLYPVCMSSNGLTAAERREDLDDGQTAGMTSAGRNPETVANVRELVTTDRRVTTKLIWGANCTSLGRGFVKILGNTKICTKSVPRSLTDELIVQ